MKIVMDLALFNQIVTILQELPAKSVYNIIKAMENLPKIEDKKEE